MDTGFAACHPALNFIFFALAIAGGMCFVHPLFLAVSLAASLTYYMLLRGRVALRPLGWMLALGVLAGLANPLFVTRGETLLFLWAGGRRFTLEALLYGLAAGGMLVTVLLWFGCYNAVMTDDKFQYLFAGAAPSLAMVLSMTLRLVPLFERRAAQISLARRCVGKGAADGRRRERLENGAQVLSALTQWALEGSVETADSMRARGWGCGPRGRFSIWRFGRRDAALGAVMAAAGALLAAGVLGGGARAAYYPVLSLPCGGWTAAALAGYGALCFLPAAVTIWEEISWRISRSKI